MSARVLATGIRAAIGSDYRQAAHRLVFVEYGGTISAINLAPTGTLVSSGTAVLRGTWTFDFDAGVEAGKGQDVFWEQMTDVARQLVPQGPAALVNVGVTDFAALDPAALAGLAFGSTPIPGSDDASNQLVVGDVFAVRTHGGNYAKVQVLAYGYDLTLQWETWQPGQVYEVLGSGYGELEDIVVSSDETHAWVSERDGLLYRVDLTAANRASASTLVIASAFTITAPQQLAVDESSSLAYVVEYAPSGRLLRVDLSSGDTTVVASGLEGAVGLALDAATGVAYVTEQAASGGRLTRVQLSTGRRDLVVGGLTAPFFLTWADAGHSALFTTLREPANQVVRVDLATGTVATVLDAVPSQPSSVALASATTMFVCCNDEVDLYELSPYVATGPTLLGIGLVPADKLVAGLATTDPGYLYPVANAPFDGELAVMVNHAGAFTGGAAYYSLEVDGVAQIIPFSDYEWLGLPGAFELRATAPVDGVFYPVRTPSELWYNPDLGYLLDSAPLPDGLHTLSVRLFGAPTYGAELGTSADPGRSVDVMVNHRLPRTIIDGIWNDGALVGPCGIVHVAGGTSVFSFQLTADHPSGYLSSWSLTALWGADRSATVAAEAYAPPPISWTGVTAALEPAAGWDAAVPGDPSSTQCAHTFILDAWDRTTNGYASVHYATTHVSLTILP